MFSLLQFLIFPDKMSCLFFIGCYWFFPRCQRGKDRPLLAMKDCGPLVTENMEIFCKADNKVIQLFDEVQSLNSYIYLFIFIGKTSSSILKIYKVS